MTQWSARGGHRWPARGRIRPAGVSKSAISLAAICVALFITAITTGAGWLLVLLALIAGVVGVAVTAPALLLVRTDVHADAPRDAQVGRAVPIGLTVRAMPGPVAVRARIDAGSTMSGWHRADVGIAGSLTLDPARRGVVEQIQVEVRCAAPLGLVRWRRRFAPRLRVPLAIAPAPAEVGHTAVGSGTVTDSSTQLHRHAGASGLTRGLRDYVPGDPLAQVHWAATARHGDVVVREFDVPARPAVVVVADLGPDTAEADAVERNASLAYGHVHRALADGADVTLVCRHTDGVRVLSAPSARDAGRALAAAVTGPPLAAPPDQVARGAVVVATRPANPAASPARAGGR